MRIRLVSPLADEQHVTGQTVLRKVPGKALPFIHEWITYRRDRQVYLLTDGKRSIVEIARLLHLDAAEVAYSIRRLIEGGYIEAQKTYE